MARTLSLVVRNLVFTVVVPGLGGFWAPWQILGGHYPAPAMWEAVVVIAAGVALYVWCVWNFAAVGRGTPGPWDAPRQVVATGPYRWVRNPIYLAALLVVLGQAWLFMSLPLLAYAGAMALCCHLFVIGYEEPMLRRRFGSAYLDYRNAVPRWVPRPPGRTPRTAPWADEPGVGEISDAMISAAPAPRISQSRSRVQCGRRNRRPRWSWKLCPVYCMASTRYTGGPSGGGSWLAWASSMLHWMWLRVISRTWSASMKRRPACVAITIPSKRSRSGICSTCSSVPIWVPVLLSTGVPSTAAW